jgi:hypothetical protein
MNAKNSIIQSFAILVALLASSVLAADDDFPLKKVVPFTYVVDYEPSGHRMAARLSSSPTVMAP